MNRITPYAALLGFIATIPLASWTLDRYGFVHVPALGMVASGVVWIGAAFVLRDIAQLLTTKWHTLAAVAIGAVLSAWIATPALALAGAAAFGLSELLDWAIYTPMALEHFIAAVLISSVAGGTLDSALFLRIAFHSYNGWWQLAAAKGLIILAVTPLAAWVRRRAVPRHVTR